MSASWRVREVRVIEDYAVWVRFKDGLEGVVRFLPGFFRGVFSHLKDPAQFRQVTVVGGGQVSSGKRAPDCSEAVIPA